MLAVPDDGAVIDGARGDRRLTAHAAAQRDLLRHRHLRNRRTNSPTCYPRDTLRYIPLQELLGTTAPARPGRGREILRNIKRLAGNLSPRVGPSRPRKRRSLSAVSARPVLQAVYKRRPCPGRRARGLALRHRPARSRRRSGSRTPSARGEFADDRHVLLPDVDLHGGRLVGALRHQRRAQLEDAASCRRPRRSPCTIVVGIEPGLHAEHHRLGARDVVDATRRLATNFILLPLPNSPR